ncbi:U24-ctenitoxin-Pn1a-like [Argiope bruennichi]|uniref:U24-ctenitoxin-Pn1a like protein n=1 Tax=Argiope bruennichi TaxID=94029 RepID=A0A8T0EKV5_ARGBR|nr:U24-ctenitoxin-Pn1a-like [Argiope bruennichi]KAF8771978.1 U24-ctenitoxin-Pn1a like protein [Argiope bruennichi]
MKFLLCRVVTTTLCVVGIIAKSECENQQRSALKGSEGEWIPKCTESGDFKDLQCKEDGSECKCVRPDGTHIKEFSPKIKACACHVHLDKVRAKAGRMVGVYKPQCEEDGTYKRTQCNGSIGSCWCVDERGRKTNKTTDC